tara:strand:- start:8275 stop:8649 length:375 start_codon:yes stop_codon:yes gene_type:complete
MSMNEFVKTLSEEQKAALLSALAETEEVIEEAEETSDITEDFRVVKKSSLKSNGRREPVKARQNTWTDTGEHKDIATPDVQRTPRNRPPPRKKNVVCNACGKSFKVNASIVYGEYYRCDRCTGK